MRNKQEWRRARVSAVTAVADDVRMIDFAVEGGTPRFDPGSHLNLRVAIGGRAALRTYTCLPASEGHLRVAVKRHVNSRGGSRFMWGLEPGASVSLTLPENRFELSWRPGTVLLMAGGIGITPIFGMALTLAARGREFRLVYGGRCRSAMPFVEELEAALGNRLELFAGDDDRRIDVEAEIARLPADGTLYVCGPLRLLDAVKSAWAAAKRPLSRLRYEVFGDSGRFAEASFRVAVPSSCVELEVRPDQSMLDALLGAGVDMIYDCQRGECGLCAVTVLSHEDGEIDHRDVFFSEEEKHEGQKLCTCVSRFTGGAAVIDTGHRA